jgi:hypothetical protein
LALDASNLRVPPLVKITAVEESYLGPLNRTE